VYVEDCYIGPKGGGKWSEGPVEMGPVEIDPADTMDPDAPAPTPAAPEAPLVPTPASTDRSA
jgi:hypothetical protein